MSALKSDTEEGHQQVAGPVEMEGSENEPSAEKRSPNQERHKRGGKGRRVKFEAFPIEEVHRRDPEEKKSHVNVPPDWAVLDCGAAKSLSGAELQP